MIKWEIQHHTICQGWVNTWHDIEDDGTEIASTFDSEAEAQTALDEFFADIQDDIDNGIREPDMGYNRDEFRIVLVNDGGSNG